MTLEIIIPVHADQLEMLETAIHKLKENTLTPHTVTVLLEGRATEEQVAYCPALVGAMVDDLAWKFRHGTDGYNADLHRAIAASEGQFTVVAPARCVIVDKDWFGKLQMPFSRVSKCGMTFAFDSMAGNTRPPHPWDYRYAVPGGVFMVHRNFVVEVQKRLLCAAEAEDYASCWMSAARQLGLETWACPSVRLNATASAPRG